MQATVFQINNRYWVDSHRNEIREMGQVTRLEPRIIKLLCLLAERPGELLSRDFIIKEIWNDYPGANEGLNQAISFLRKQLGDEDKMMIKTHPKTGYSFHATVSWEAAHIPTKKKPSAWIKFTVAAIVLALLTGSLIIYFNRKNERTGLSPNEAAEISRQDSIHQAEKMKQSKGN